MDPGRGGRENPPPRRKMRKKDTFSIWFLDVREENSPLNASVIKPQNSQEKYSERGIQVSVKNIQLKG